MKEDSAVKSRILFPLQLAEDANRGFVKVIQHITRFINYDFHTTRPEITGSRFHVRIPYSRNQYQFIASKQINNSSAVDPVPSSVSDEEINAQLSPKIEPAEMITLLFSDFTEERLAAIRWISDHKYGDALPILKSILLIEDNHQVYEEACKLINILRESDTERFDRE